jgi:hypothetical protein
MQERELEISIGPNGEVNLATHGIKGAACNRLMEAFVQALGKLKHAEQTAEFYETTIDVEVEEHLGSRVRR